MKRFISIFLVSIMLSSIVPVSAQAQSYQTIQDFCISVDGKAYQTKGCLGSEDGELYLSPSVIKQLLGAMPSDAAKRNEAGYVSLKSVCDGLHVSYYEYDSVLKAVYIWKDLGDKSLEDARISFYKLGTPSGNSITYKQFFSVLDNAVKIADETKLSDWESKFTQGRNSDRIMTRYEGMLALLNAAALLGSDYSEFNTDWTGLNEKIGEKVWDEINSIPNPYEFIPNNYPYALGGFQKTNYVYDWDDSGVAYRYSFGRVSLISGKTLFDYDEKSNSMRPADYMTFSEALNAVARFLDSGDSQDEYISLSSDEALNYDNSYITDDLLNKSMALPGVSDENHPEWHGFVFNDGGYYEQTDINTALWDKSVRNIADWGFNSVRYMLSYQVLFDDNVTKVNLTNLRKLDRIVASAIKYNLHLNIVTYTLPGRWTKTDFNTYTCTGSFDLFTNTEEQEQAKAVWALLSERYRNIPSASLSFCPIWEAQNKDLSSGLPVEPYTVEDVDKVYSDLVGTIKQNDPDRFVLYEPTANNSYDRIIDESQEIKSDIEKKYSDVLMMSNFCENPFVYAEMTAVQGQNIDNNNHSMFKPPYPVTVYAAQQRILNGSPLQISGALVKGTVIDLYLSKAEGNGTFKITADGVDIYSEDLSDGTYKTDYPLSGFYPYAKSEKHISVTLSNDVNNLEVSYSGSAFEWSGIDVTLPKEYAVNRWWYMSPYDAKTAGTDWAPPTLKSTSTIMISPFNLGKGRSITINPDVTYTTDAIYDQSNKQTIENWGTAMAVFSPNLLIRIENATFNIGNDYKSSIKYYDDLLTMCDEHGFSWFNNELDNIFSNSSQTTYGGAEKDRYQDGYLLTDMLKVFQKHLTKPTVLEAVNHTISAATNDNSCGSVTGGGSFEEGITATLTATPARGCHFERWTENGAEVSTSANYSFKVTGDRTFVAVFAKDEPAPTPMPTPVPTPTPAPAVVSVGISCAETDVTQYGGSDGSITITASGGNSGTFQYSIDNGASWESSASFTGLMAGTYTVLARDAANTANVSAAISVTINQTNPVSYFANKLPAKANAGVAWLIKPVNAPKGFTFKSASFASGNNSVARVDASGIVNFLKGGKAKLTVKMVFQKGTKTKIVKAVKNVVVNQKIASITLNNTNAILHIKKTVKLIPAFTPSSASNKKVKWSSSNPRIASVSNKGVVTGKKAGTAVITCTAQDGSKVSASCTVTVT